MAVHASPKPPQPTVALGRNSLSVLLEGHTIFSGPFKGSLVAHASTVHAIYDRYSELSIFLLLLCKQQLVFVAYLFVVDHVKVEMSLDYTILPAVFFSSQLAPRECEEITGRDAFSSAVTSVSMTPINTSFLGSLRQSLQVLVSFSKKSDAHLSPAHYVFYIATPSCAELFDRTTSCISMTKLATFPSDAVSIGSEPSTDKHDAPPAASLPQVNAEPALRIIHLRDITCAQPRVADKFPLTALRSAGVLSNFYYDDSCTTGLYVFLASKESHSAAILCRYAIHLLPPALDQASRIASLAREPMDTIRICPHISSPGHLVSLFYSCPSTPPASISSIVDASTNTDLFYTVIVGNDRDACPNLTVGTLSISSHDAFRVATHSLGTSAHIAESWLTHVMSPSADFLSSLKDRFSSKDTTAEMPQSPPRSANASTASMADSMKWVSVSSLDDRTLKRALPSPALQDQPRQPPPVLLEMLAQTACQSVYNVAAIPELAGHFQYTRAQPSVYETALVHSELISGSFEISGLETVADSLQQNKLRHHCTFQILFGDVIKVFYSILAETDLSTKHTTVVSLSRQFISDAGYQPEEGRTSLGESALSFTSGRSFITFRIFYVGNYLFVASRSSLLYMKAFPARIHFASAETTGATEFAPKTRHINVIIGSLSHDKAPAPLFRHYVVRLSVSDPSDAVNSTEALIVSGDGARAINFCGDVQLISSTKLPTDSSGPVELSSIDCCASSESIFFMHTRWDSQATETHICCLRKKQLSTLDVCPLALGKQPGQLLHLQDSIIMYIASVDCTVVLWALLVSDSARGRIHLCLKVAALPHCSDGESIADSLFLMAPTILLADLSESLLAKQILASPSEYVLKVYVPADFLLRAGGRMIYVSLSSSANTFDPPLYRVSTLLQNLMLFPLASQGPHSLGSPGSLVPYTGARYLDNLAQLHIPVYDSHYISFFRFYLTTLTHSERSLYVADIGTHVAERLGNLLCTTAFQSYHTSIFGGECVITDIPAFNRALNLAIHNPQKSIAALPALLARQADANFIFREFVQRRYAVKECEYGSRELGELCDDVETVSSCIRENLDALLRCGDASEPSSVSPVSTDMYGLTSNYPHIDIDRDLNDSFTTLTQVLLSADDAQIDATMSLMPLLTHIVNFWARPQLESAFADVAANTTFLQNVDLIGNPDAGNVASSLDPGNIQSVTALMGSSLFAALPLEAQQSLRKNLGKKLRNNQATSLDVPDFLASYYDVLGIDYALLTAPGTRGQMLPMLTLAYAKKMYLPYAAQDNHLLAIVSAIGDNEYKLCKNPMAVTLYYVVTGRVQLLAQLFKLAKNDKVSDFLRRDFSLEASRLAASKNAFVLLSKGDYLASAGWFYLSGNSTECITVLSELRYCNDIDLALLMARLIISDMMTPSARNGFRLADNRHALAYELYAIILRRLDISTCTPDNQPSAFSTVTSISPTPRIAEGLVTNELISHPSLKNTSTADLIKDTVLPTMHQYLAKAYVLLNAYPLMQAALAHDMRSEFLEQPPAGDCATEAPKLSRDQEAQICRTKLDTALSTIQELLATMSLCLSAVISVVRDVLPVLFNYNLVGYATESPAAENATTASAPLNLDTICAAPLCILSQSVFALSAGTSTMVLSVLGCYYDLPPAYPLNELLLPEGASLLSESVQRLVYPCPASAAILSQARGDIVSQAQMLLVSVCGMLTSISNECLPSTELLAALLDTLYCYTEVARLFAGRRDTLVCATYTESFCSSLLSLLARRILYTVSLSFSAEKFEDYCALNSVSVPDHPELSIATTDDALVRAFFAGTSCNRSSTASILGMFRRLPRSCSSVIERLLCIFLRYEYGPLLTLQKTLHDRDLKTEEQTPKTETLTTDEQFLKDLLAEDKAEAATPGVSDVPDHITGCDILLMSLSAFLGASVRADPLSDTLSDLATEPPSECAFMGFESLKLVVASLFSSLPAACTRTSAGLPIALRCLLTCATDLSFIDKNASCSYALLSSQRTPSMAALSLPKPADAEPQASTDTLTVTEKMKRELYGSFATRDEAALLDNAAQPTASLEVLQCAATSMRILQFIMRVSYKCAASTQPLLLPGTKELVLLAALSKCVFDSSESILLLCKSIYARYGVTLPFTETAELHADSTGLLLGVKPSTLVRPTKKDAELEYAPGMDDDTNRLAFIQNLGPRRQQHPEDTPGATKKTRLISKYASVYEFALSQMHDKLLSSPYEEAVLALMDCSSVADMETRVSALQKVICERRRAREAANAPVAKKLVEAADEKDRATEGRPSTIHLASTSASLSIDDGAYAEFSAGCRYVRQVLYAIILSNVTSFYTDKVMRTQDGQLSFALFGKLIQSVMHSAVRLHLYTQYALRHFSVIFRRSAMLDIHMSQNLDSMRSLLTLPVRDSTLTDCALVGAISSLLCKDGDFLAAVGEQSITPSKLLEHISNTVELPSPQGSASKVLAFLYRQYGAESLSVQSARPKMDVRATPSSPESATPTISRVVIARNTNMMEMSASGDYQPSSDISGHSVSTSGNGGGRSRFTTYLSAGTLQPEHTESGTNGFGDDLNVARTSGADRKSRHTHLACSNSVTLDHESSMTEIAITSPSGADALHPHAAIFFVVTVSDSESSVLLCLRNTVSYAYNPLLRSLSVCTITNDVLTYSIMLTRPLQSQINDLMHNPSYDKNIADEGVSSSCSLQLISSTSLVASTPVIKTKPSLGTLAAEAPARDQPLKVRAPGKSRRISLPHITPCAPNSTLFLIYNDTSVTLARFTPSCSTILLLRTLSAQDLVSSTGISKGSIRDFTKAAPLTSPSIFRAEIISSLRILVVLGDDKHAMVLVLDGLLVRILHWRILPKVKFVNDLLSFAGAWFERRYVFNLSCRGDQFFVFTEEQGIESL